MGRKKAYRTIDRSSDWQLRLADAIKESPTDGIIDVATEAQKFLGDHARVRMDRPDVTIRAPVTAPTPSP